MAIMIASNTSMVRNSSLEGLDNDPIISDEVLFWVQIICAIGICAFVSLFGIIANIIHIIVFIRQGVLSDSSTVSLLGLAVSDLMCLVLLLWLAICFSLVYARPSGLPFDPMSVMFITAGRPKVMFTQITRWITVYISLERCVCVLFPFQASKLFSPHKTAVIIPSIYVLTCLIGYMPLYVTQYLRFETDVRTNRTILVGYMTSNHPAVLTVCSILNGQVLQITAVVAVFVFTQVMAIRVDVSRKWRESTTATGIHKSTEEVANHSDKKIGTKDKKLVKMIRVICIIFLICYTPELMIVTAEIIMPEIRPGGRYHNLFFFLYSFSFILEAFNSSINFFVYFTMSSKFKKEFSTLFGSKRLENNKR